MPRLVIITSKLRELIACNANKEAQFKQCDQLDNHFDDLIHLVTRLAIAGDDPVMIKPLKEEAERLLLRY
jgi:hypothetical protein